LVERNEKRFDALLDQQNRIVTERMGTGDRPVNQGVHQPIQLRKPWKSVQASFEAKDRQEHWKQRVKEVEERDAAAMNAKEIK
jgi:single-stranded DNA-specific DHH superfamily exonuclease